MPISTPVALLIFNRSELTEKVFRAIAEAKPAKLLVVADGPRFPEEEKMCAAARAVVEKIDWDCTLLTNFSDTNLGCKRRISSGLDWIFSEVEEAIILEDDCLPNQSFFKFCELMLARYRDDERIMMISGDNFLLQSPEVAESYFFSRYFAIWGWATWRRAWKMYDLEMKDWKDVRIINALSAYYPQYYMQTYVTSIFDKAANNEVDTWDIQWLYSCLVNNGLAVMPKVNLVSNIGITGVHSAIQSPNQMLPSFFLDCENIVHPRLVVANSTYDNEFLEKNFKPKEPVGFSRRTVSALKVVGMSAYRQLKPLLPKIARRLAFAQNEVKPNPKDYSTIVGVGTIVPCQIEAYFLALNRYVDEGAKVLDIGFGLGYGLNIMAIKAKEVSGVDIDEKVYHYCQNTIVGRNPRLMHLGMYDGYTLNFPDNFFDVLTCVDVIEHVEDYHRFIKEMLRVSRIGVFFSTPNRRPEYTNLDGTPKNFWHLREWSFEEFDLIVTQHGRVDWNFLNGPFEGPFTRSDRVHQDTLTLSPFIYKDSHDG